MKTFLIYLLFAGTALLAGQTTPDVHWSFLIMGLLGGLSLFLYGMNKLSHGMKKAAGNRMRRILATITQNRVIGMTVGALVTMIIQSSSATTVMLVSFVQAQLLSFGQSLGVILGADIGTTVTTQLIAFKVTDYALLMISIGFGMTILSKKDSTRSIGEAILGFGILFYGMKLMTDTMAPLRTYGPFLEALKGLENPLLGILLATVFTALIQSSAAFIGIVIVLSQQGLLTLNAGIPLIFGANVGTCITAGLASIGTSREAKRVALAHVLFKIGGVLLFIFWIPYFAEFVRLISPHSPLEGMEKLAAETPRQIANAHTIFNISLAILFLPFTALFAKILDRYYPDKPEVKGLKPVILHLDYKQIAQPAMAINLAHAEISTMVQILNRMLKAAILPFLNGDSDQDIKYPQMSLLEGLRMREGKIDYLEEKVTHYLIQISRQELDDEQAGQVYAMMSIVKDIESIGDILDKNMAPLIQKKQTLKASFSEEGKSEIKAYHTKVMKQISRLSAAFSELSFELAQKVMKKDIKYRALESEYRLAHFERIQREKQESIETHEIHMELMDLLKQINVYLANIAKTITGIREPV